MKHFRHCELFFSPHFSKSMVDMTTCLKTVVVGKQGHASCKILLLDKAFFVAVEFHGDHKIATKLRSNLATLSFGDITKIYNSGICMILIQIILSLMKVTYKAANIFSINTHKYITRDIVLKMNTFDFSD